MPPPAPPSSATRDRRPHPAHGPLLQLIARRLGLDDELCERILVAAPMHDIGKVGTPTTSCSSPAASTTRWRSCAATPHRPRHPHRPRLADDPDGPPDRPSPTTRNTTAAATPTASPATPSPGRADRRRGGRLRRPHLAPPYKPPPGNSSAPPPPCAKARAPTSTPPAWTPSSTSGTPFSKFATVSKTNERLPPPPRLRLGLHTLAQQLACSSPCCSPSRWAATPSASGWSRPTSSNTSSCATRTTSPPASPRPWSPTSPGASRRDRLPPAQVRRQLAHPARHRHSTARAPSSPASASPRAGPRRARRRYAAGAAAGAAGKAARDGGRIVVWAPSATTPRRLAAPRVAPASSENLAHILSDSLLAGVLTPDPRHPGDPPVLRPPLHSLQEATAFAPGLRSKQGQTCAIPAGRRGPPAGRRPQLDLHPPLRGQSALATSESRNRAITEAALDCIISTDTEAGCSSSTRRRTHLRHLAQAEALHKPIADLIFPERLPRHPAPDRRTCS